MKMFRVDKEETVSTWIKGRASTAQVETWRLAEHNIFES